MATNPKARLAGPSRPLGSPDVPQFFLPAGSEGGTYAPRLYGAAKIHFKKRKIDETRRLAFTLPLELDAKTTKAIDWETAQATEIMPERLLKEPPKAANYLPLPLGTTELKAFTRWAKNFDRWLARTQKLVVSPKSETEEEVAIGPKRGGVSVELVAIVWELI